MILNPIKWSVRVNRHRRKVEKDCNLLWGFPPDRILTAGHSSFNVYLVQCYKAFCMDIFVYIALLVTCVLGIVQVIWAWDKLLNYFCLFLQCLSPTRSPAFVFRWPYRSYTTNYLSIVLISVMLYLITWVLVILQQVAGMVGLQE